MVNELLANGHPVVQEIRAGLSVLEHSFVVLPTGKGEDRDIVIDPTWQRFLPRGKVTDKLPRVLVGTRSSVANQAMASGVDELTARIWQDGGKMTTEQQRQADRQAEAAAEQADADGAWERFAQGR